MGPVPLLAGSPRRSSASHGCWVLAAGRAGPGGRGCLWLVSPGWPQPWVPPHPLKCRWWGMGFFPGLKQRLLPVSALWLIQTGEFQASLEPPGSPWGDSPHLSSAVLLCLLASAQLLCACCAAGQNNLFTNPHPRPSWLLEGPKSQARPLHHCHGC